MLKIIKQDHTPRYRFELDEKDLVTIRPRKPIIENVRDLTLDEWALEKGREYARNAGWDFFVVQANWQDMARTMIASGNPPKDASKAFVGYCKKLNKLR